MATNAASRNPFNKESYTALLPKVQMHAKKITEAVLSVAKVEKDKDGKDVIPASDDAGLLILALTVLNREYTKQMRDVGADSARIAEIKKMAQDARSALRLATKKMEELTTGLVDADEFLATARNDYNTRHGDEAERRDADREKLLKKQLEDLAARRAARQGKGRKTATANG